MKGSILYSPWGVPGTKTGELSTFPAQGHLGFQGQLTDALTGQVDMLTRYYEPTLGRLDTRDVLFGDPTDPSSLNLHVYGVDNPLSYTDPTGMSGKKGGAGPTDCGRACEAVIVAQIEAESEALGCPGCSPAVVNPQPPPVLSLSQFQRLPERQRIQWLDQFTAYYDLEDWFSGIRGVLMAGVATGFLDRGSWSSWVDASILHGIQEGMRTYRGAIRESSNPGAIKWAQFFDAFYGGGSSAGRDVRLKGLWASSETASTEYGRSVAAQQGLHSTSGEKAVNDWANIWRSTVQYGTTPLAPEYILRGSWPEMFDPRVPWQVTMNFTMRIYLNGM